MRTVADKVLYIILLYLRIIIHYYNMRDRWRTGFIVFIFTVDGMI